MAIPRSPFLLAVILLAVPISSAPPSQTSPAIKQAASANTKFMFDLLRSLRDGKNNKAENDFFSPYSISAALAMTSLGAAGNTLAEIDKTCHFDVVNQNDPYAIHKVYQQLIELYNAGNANYSLSTANRLFGDNTFMVLQSFQENAKKYYHAELEQLDFKSGKAEGVINAWVEQQTQNKIKDLIPQQSLQDAVLVLVNAIYFKGTWVTKFNKDDTKKRPFHLSTTKQKDVDMMSVTADFKYYHDDNLKVKVLEMPYSGGDLSMIVLLPDDIEGLPVLTDKLTEVTLNSLLGKMSKQKVEVKFPKFKLETSYALVGTLAKLGIHDLFSNSALLTGISNVSIKVSKVLHKAFMEVDEEGTTAAAATSVIFTKTNMIGGSKQRDIKFIADRPFFFAIVDRRQDNVLFSGSLKNIQ